MSHLKLGLIDVNEFATLDISDRTLEIQRTGYEDQIIGKAHNQVVVMPSVRIVDSSLVNGFEEAVSNTRIKHECPKCGIDIHIAGFYNGADTGVNGMSVAKQYQCHQCDSMITPKRRESG